MSAVMLTLPGLWMRVLIDFMLFATAVNAAVEESSVDVNRGKRMGCGVCVETYPVSALSLARDEKKGLPLDVKMMIQDKKKVKK